MSSRVSKNAPPPGVRITYQKQYRKCGSAHCKPCEEGVGHGPYWYGYWRDEAKKIHSFYVGKELPKSEEATRV